MKSSGSSGSTEVDYSGFFNRISSYSAPDNYVSNPSYYDDYFSYNTSNSSSEIANPVHNTDGTEAMKMTERGSSGEANIVENIMNYLGNSSSVIENSMKASVLSLSEMKSLLISEGAPIEMIDNIISRDAAIGGVARIGGRLIFYGQLGYNIYDAVKNPTLPNIALKSSDTFFSAIATYGGWPGLGIAGIYYLNKESIIITMKSLNQGLIKSNPNVMQNYIGGLGITPFVSK